MWQVQRRISHKMSKNRNSFGIILRPFILFLFLNYVFIPNRHYSFAIYSTRLFSVLSVPACEKVFTAALPRDDLFLTKHYQNQMYRMATKNHNKSFQNPQMEEPSHVQILYFSIPYQGRFSGEYFSAVALQRPFFIRIGLSPQKNAICYSDRYLFEAVWVTLQCWNFDTFRVFLLSSVGNLRCYCSGCWF